MRYPLLLLLFSFPLLLTAQLFPELGGQRAGISALTFLKVDVSPRSAGVGGANVCLTGDAFSTFTNPATLAETEGFSVGASNTFWAAGIPYSFLSVNKPTQAGHFGLSIQSLSSGALPVRTEFNPGGTGEYFYAGYFTAGLTYSKRLTDMFTYGFTGKYVREQLADFTAQTVVVDLGFLYRTDFNELSFSVLLQNFGLNSGLKGMFDIDKAFEHRPRTIESYPAPTIFKIGVSMVPWRDEENNQSLTTLLQLNHPNDNAENIRIGLEYSYHDVLFLRAGYKFNVKDQNYPTAGIGLRSRIGRHPLMLDYALDPTNFLGLIHRVGVSFHVNKMDR